MAQTLKEIADEISGLLAAAERSGREKHGMFHAGSCRAGSYVWVWWRTYQPHAALRREEALEYLQWLKEGHVTFVWEFRRERVKRIVEGGSDVHGKI